MPVSAVAHHTPTHLRGHRCPRVTEVAMSAVLQSLSTELADAVESAGRAVVASLARRDPSTDLAVLKLAGQSIPTASLRPDATPKVGELVIALGRPGPSLTASWGVVSGVDGPWRTWQGGEIDSLLRLDLAIYDGFSGGPLIDAAGRVLGINTSALARGVPVTIPVATVERVVTELLERGTIRRAYLGIGTQP